MLGKKNPHCYSYDRVKIFNNGTKLSAGGIVDHIHVYLLGPDSTNASFEPAFNALELLCSHIAN